MYMKSVISLKEYIRDYFGEEGDPEVIEKVFYYIRRKTDHPLYRPDWTNFLSSLNFLEIVKAIKGE